MRLIDADELKKRAMKVMFRDVPECGEFDAVSNDDIDCMPTSDPESLRATAHWETCELIKADVAHGECVRYKDMAARCSNCCHAYDKYALWDRNFCPNCGARMEIE